jgi:hypothetical protein
MMHTFDPVRFDAFARLLARPDPADLPRRTHVYRYEGDPDRRSTRLPELFMRWLQQRHLDRDLEEPPARAMRTLTRRTRPVRPANPSLRLLLRPTGTG